MESKKDFWAKCLFIHLLCWVSFVEASENKAQIFKPVFRVLFVDLLTTLDPQKSTRTVDHMLSAYLFDPLFTLKKGEPVPVLVDSYTHGT